MIAQALPGMEWSPEEFLPGHFPEHCPGTEWGLDASFWRRVSRGAPTFADTDSSPLRAPTPKELCAYWSVIWPTKVWDRTKRGKAVRSYGDIFEGGKPESFRMLAGNWVSWARESELRAAVVRVQSTLGPTQLSSHSSPRHLERMSVAARLLGR